MKKRNEETCQLATEMVVPASRYSEMTLQEVLDLAKQMGFKPRQQGSSFYSWESSNEHAAIEFLQMHCPEIFEEEE